MQRQEDIKIVRISGVAEPLPNGIKEAFTEIRYDK